MQPKIPLRMLRPNVWSHNTNYVGAIGLHSENGAKAKARKNSIEKRLNKVISILEDMERKEYQQMEKSRKDIQSSMLAYTERARKVNAVKFNSLSPINSASNKGSVSDRSSQSSSGSNSHVVTKRSPEKTRRISLPKIESNNKKLFRERRLSSVSDSITFSHSKSSQDDGHRYEKYSRFAKSQDKREKKISIDENCTEKDNDEQSDLMISPFPFESYNYDLLSNISTSTSPRAESPKRRVSYKQYSVERELERQRNLAKRKQISEQSADPFDHQKEIQREQARNRKAALLLERARQDALKNKKDIWNTFCYSSAVEELYKKSDPLSYVASNEDFISKVEVDKEGTIKQTFGPGVLNIIGVDELNNIQGMRIKWSAKSRPQPKEEELTLPPITVGQHQKSFSRELSRDPEHLSVHKLKTETSIVSAVSVEG